MNPGRLPTASLDEVGPRYSIVVHGEPVIAEYLVVPEARELRVTTVVRLN